MSYFTENSIKGERTMSQGFVAQYAAEAARQVEGVLDLDSGVLVSIKEALGVEHDGRGVKVEFGADNSEFVTITIYPICRFGYVLPEVAWNIQEKIKNDVELYTGLIVDFVHVQVMGVQADSEAINQNMV
ncbi:MAG: Asp23/Gls24 family envelope stress response protein [Clostridiaceae bacterium]|nr:Asp23/Gls24 family envelope stress response protein [Clostridiaceae bacterium]